MPGRKKTRITVAEIKATVRRRDGMACTDCGRTNEKHIEQTGKQLEVHRLTPGSRYTVEGCVTLCFWCHKKKPSRQPGEPDMEGTKVVLTMSPWLYRLLADAAREGCRPIPWHAIRMLEQAFIAEGRLTSEEHAQHRAEDWKAKMERDCSSDA